MIKPVAIEKREEQHPALNFEFLRKVGIELIQRYAGKTWTDFNLHDPGITILEQLCFAITDLAYRTEFPIQDLLADQHGKIDYANNAFFLKEDILTTNPVSIKDYRKAIIDEIDELDNIWFYPIKSELFESGLSGLYSVECQVSSGTAEKMYSDETVADKVKEKVRKAFGARRNLCEDIAGEIIVLKPLKLTIEAEILANSGKNPEEILAKIYHQLESSLNQPVRYYAEKELLELGLETEDIYDGPLLRKGFIPDFELHDRRTSIDPTEITKAISQVEGVLSVKKLKIVNGNSGRSTKPFKIPENSFPLLDIKGSENQIKLFLDKFEMNIKAPVFRNLLQKIRESDNRKFISSFYKRPKTFIKGNYRNNQVYYSLQEQFPNIYGIGSEGLLQSSSKLRKAQAKQLKGFLLIFEQVLANYLAQLANVNEVFSVDLKQEHSQSYFNNPLYAVPDVQYLLKAFTSKNPELDAVAWEEFKSDENNKYLTDLAAAAENDSVFVQRKNQLFDHLLARFNEFLLAHPIHSYTSLYELNGGDTRFTTELAWKSNILKNIPELGSARVRAENYLDNKASEKTPDFRSRLKAILYISENDDGKLLSEALDSKNITIEKSEVPAHVLDSMTYAESAESSWQIDMPDISMTELEMADLQYDNQVIGLDDISDQEFRIQKQPLNFLKFGLDIKNYRIAPDLSNSKRFLVIFKSPGELSWKAISRFSTSDGAMKSIKKLIDYLREVNVSSEGYYLLEHILLRPSLETKVFGFRFVASNGQKLMEHTRWLTFKEREEVLSKLIDIISTDTDLSPEKLSPYCKLNLYASISDLPESYTSGQNEEPGQSLFNYFKVFSSNREKFLSRFEMVIKGEDNRMITEDFFSHRMSVIFPSWPARFQDKNFRSSAENLFRLNAPAHLKIHFHWMGILDLKRFESIYMDWKNFLASGPDDETRSELQNALIQLLQSRLAD